MASVLFSGVGTTDPVRGNRDGAMMHIMRHYRPDTVYLFLTSEMIELDRKDDRFSKSFRQIAQEVEGYTPELIRFETDITNPSDMDLVFEPMEELLAKIRREHPVDQILVNLTSGTPQMQIVLAQIALNPRYGALGIQVPSPENASSKALRTNDPRYQVDEELAGNQDCAADAPNRCHVPKMMAIRRDQLRSRMAGLIAKRSYGTIAQLADELPAPMAQLAEHLDYRSRFLLDEAEACSRGLEELGLPVGSGVYNREQYEMVEYFAMLKHLVHLERYTDFMLRLNPLLVRMQLALLRRELAERGIRLDYLLPVRRSRRYVDPDRIDEVDHNLRDYMETRFTADCNSWYRKVLETRDVSIKMLNYILEYYDTDNATVTLLSNCERANERLRNSSAHSLFTITNADIKDVSGLDAETMVQGLERVLMVMLADRGDPHLADRLAVYEQGDQLLMNCL